MHINYLQRCNAYGESYRISYTGWGNPESQRKLLYLHGLNRNGRDCDYLANALIKEDYYIIAPDLPGRGNSSYLTDHRGYTLAANLADIIAVLDHWQLAQVDLVGNSLGGILGMHLAAMPTSPIKKLILVDIGAEVEMSGIARIASYNSHQPTFANLAAISAYLQQLSVGDGIYDPQVWQNMLLNSCQKNSHGYWELKRDLALATTFSTKLPHLNKLQFWEEWHRNQAPTLVIHGAQSDLLLVNTLLKMQEIHPQTEILSVADAGHSPYLYRQEHLQAICQFLTKL